MSSEFKEFFSTATERQPYDYQRRLAEADDWPLAVSVGTGLGKTAALVLAWLWRRRYAGADVKGRTPRRLIYCLPQRALVQQTAASIREWLERLGLSDDTIDTNTGVAQGVTEQLSALGIPVYVLMGGELTHDWDKYLERDMVIVGTQDQLLSRSLNRGYGMSRYRWPMHFALINNDALWVIDEPQLFGNALSTTAQLQAFREQMGTYGGVTTVWVSATFRREWIETVDFAQQAQSGTVLTLNEPDIHSLGDRLNASKPLRLAPFRLEGSRVDDYAQEMADFVRTHHQSGSMTLVIVNRVQRAQAIYRAFVSGEFSERVLLIHSRFRAADRASLNAELEGLRGRDCIIVATQAVEAGMDISARTLITELAPWSSLVQRFGRCNRFGETTDAVVYWVDTGLDPTMCLPYQPELLDAAKRKLENLGDARISTLPPTDDDSPPRHVLRRRDLLSLFDNTPDLTGMDIDIAPYVRDTEDSDVQVFWRTVNGEPQKDIKRPHRDEVCRASLSMVRDYLGKRHKERARTAWTWNPLNGKWDTVRDVYPGQLILFDSADGGYTTQIGFVADSWRAVEPTDAPETVSFETHDDENDNAMQHGGMPVILADHLDHVVAEAENLHAAFSDLDEFEAVVEAARLHDIGKAHWLFQERLKRGLPENSAYRDALLAKSGGADASPIVPDDKFAQDKHPTSDGIAGGSEMARSWDDHTRTVRGFRHELASALGYLQYQQLTKGSVNERHTRLTAYLIASHHGKIRMSIRSLPTEQGPNDARLFARGVWDGDLLPEIRFTDGQIMSPIELSLQIMQAGTTTGADGRDIRSWVDGTFDLLEHFGPFRLAWLEAMVRAADGRASQKEAVRDATPV